MMNQIFHCLLIALLAAPFLSAQEAVNPTIGVPIFESETTLAEGSLILLGEAAERGLSENGGMTIVDRRRLDAVFLARDEVRHEDYLNSDREVIAAIGADFLLLGKVLTREQTDRSYTGSNGSPTRYTGVYYTMQLRLLEVATGQIRGFTSISFGGGETIQTGEAQMAAPMEAILPRLEASAARSLAVKVRNFVGQTFQGGMQMVDMLKHSKRSVKMILVASLQENFHGQELDLFVHEEYVVNGQTLQRPLQIGKARVRKQLTGGLITAKVLEGKKDILSAFNKGEIIHCLPGDQKAHWALNFMTMGMANKLLYDD